MAEGMVRIEDAASGASAQVAVAAGFNCFSWRTPFEPGGESRELLWAEPEFEAGDKRPSRSGIPLMFPFPGRIGGKTFDFDGQTYHLDSDDHLGNAIHGFAMRHAWRILQQEADSVTAEFSPAVAAPEVVGQWPGEYTLRATYRVTESRLELEIEAKNTGNGPLPLGFGTHAYFRLPLAEGADPEATIVTAPVDAEWATEAMLPTGESTPIATGEPLPAGAPLGGREYDAPHRLLPGGGTTELRDPATGRRVRQTFDDSMTCLVIYTPGHREAICLEPETCVPDPFRLQAAGVKTGLRTLAPGEAYRTSIVLEASVEGEPGA